MKKGLLVVMAQFLAFSGTARAGGFTVSDIGTRAIGRGLTNVASPDDLTALWYNPSGLTNFPGATFFSDVTLVDMNLSFDRTDDPEAAPGGYSKVENEARPRIIPFFAFSSDLAEVGIENLSLGVGGFGPYIGGYYFRDAGPQRYTMIRNWVWDAIYQFAAAYRFGDFASVGASARAIDFGYEDTLYLSIASDMLATAFEGPKPAGPEDPNYDVKVDLSVRDKWKFQWNFGLMVKPVEQVSVGFCVEPPLAIRADGTLTPHLPDSVTSGERKMTVSGDRIKLHMAIPWIFRGGVQYRHNSRFKIELDYVYEAWSRLKEVVAENIDDNIKAHIKPAIGRLDTMVIDDIVLKKYMRDIYSIRFGGDYNFTESFTGRAGYFFEEGAVPSRYYEIAVNDASKHGACAGASYKTGAFRFDAAYARIMLMPMDISDSEMMQINLVHDKLKGEPVPTAITNGKYRSSYNLVSTAVTVSLDELFGFGK